MMTQQTMAGRAIPGRESAPGAPEVAVRLVGALLALAVAAVHVADQGGITALASPHWIGWGYRLIEAGGVLTALTLLCLRPAWPVPAGLGRRGTARRRAVCRLHRLAHGGRAR